jgi:putative transposase
MKRWRELFSIGLMIRVLDVSRSGFYDWIGRGPSTRTREDERLKLEIRAAHQRSRETYGPPRLQPELAAIGVRVGRDRITRLRRSLGPVLSPETQVQGDRFASPIARGAESAEPRLPSHCTEPGLGERPDLYRHRRGWLYLAGVKDVFTCEIVGYAMGERMTPDLPGRALFRAVQQHRPPAGIIHHSDRGSQYCAEEYQSILRQIPFPGFDVP